MISSNPLLNELSAIPGISGFSRALSKNSSSSLCLTGPLARSYFIGAISLTNKLGVVSDDSFAK